MDSRFKLISKAVLWNSHNSCLQADAPNEVPLFQLQHMKTSQNDRIVTSGISQSNFSEENLHILNQIQPMVIPEGQIGN